jgi:putative membrane protein
MARVVAASLLMVALDLCIEPVAIALDFWTWQSDSVPIQNYLAWFITALALNSYMLVGKVDFDVSTARLLWLLQSLFFVLLFVGFLYSGHR